MRRSISTRELDTFMSRYPRMNRRLRGRLYLWNVHRVIRGHNSATEVELYQKMKELQIEFQFAYPGI